ncbi:hypothetical protein [Desulforamulus ruminis]|uniref:hypothetical protein n=1 Tax=Desulforamulus ruminis TaxID=1564 RepID=UPI00235480B3|nr:hypothetical protein [Desulforamulus ruminis]
MARYKKRPVVIEAFQWFNHTELNETPEWFRKAIENGTVQLNYDGTITIETFEGPHLSREGDYIIQGVKGEIYPCKPDIFEMTYEPEGSTGSITVDRERNTASGVFRVERGGGHITGHNRDKK